MIYVIKCQHCGSPFTDRKEVRKYCCRACYWAQIAEARSIDCGGPDLKRCSQCRAAKALSEFSPRADGRKRHGSCKACRAKDEGKRRHLPYIVGAHRARYGTDLEYRARQILRNIEKRSRRARLECDLTIDWLAQRFAGRCELSGVEFELTTGRRPGPRTPSVDRIRASGGYTQANCRVICHALNWAIANWGVDAFLPIADGLIKSVRKPEAA